MTITMALLTEKKVTVNCKPTFAHLCIYFYREQGERGTRLIVGACDRVIKLPSSPKLCQIVY